MNPIKRCDNIMLLNGIIIGKWPFSWAMNVIIIIASSSFKLHLKLVSLTTRNCYWFFDCPEWIPRARKVQCAFQMDFDQFISNMTIDKWIYIMQITKLAMQYNNNWVDCINCTRSSHSFSLWFAFSTQHFVHNQNTIKTRTLRLNTNQL